MVLSILPMAAFAAENVTCGHADVSSYDYEYYYYDHSDTQHFKDTYWKEVCNTCFETDDHYSRVKENHYVHRYVRTDSYTDEGVEYFEYDLVCICRRVIDSIKTETWHG